MPYVKFTGDYGAFITGRDVESALHYEDASDQTCIGFVADARLGETAIEQAEYDSLKATIQAYNDALPVVLPVTPDPGGLLLDIFGALGKPIARAVASKYPDFQAGLDRGNWPVARAAVDDALAAGDLTQSQYDILQTLFDEHGIP